MLGMSLDDLQKGVELTASQRTQIEQIIQGVSDSIRARFEEARRDGNRPNFDAMRAEMEKTRNEAMEKVKGVMTAEQREKYTKLVETRRAEYETRREEERKASMTREVDRAMEALKIANAQEAEAIKALVARVVKLRSELRSHDRDARDKVEGTLRSDGITDKAVEERLKELRAKRTALEDQLRKAQAELCAVVSAKQEAELFRRELVR
jgi:Spy/CpxP family protein refolding chaperone